MRNRTAISLVVAMGLMTGLVQAGWENQGMVTLHEEDSPFVALNIWIKVGSQDDPQGKEGLAAFTATFLADSSTASDSYEQIREKLYPMAAGYDSSVDKEMTVFTGLVHKDNLDAYYGLFKNALLAPAFKDEDFQRIKTRTMNFLRQSRRFSSDEELAKELLFREIYRGTPYEHPEEGYVKSVESITLQDVRDFYGKNYLRENVVLGLAGGYPAGFESKLRRDFDNLPTGQVARVPAPRPAAADGVRVLIVEKQTKATAISIGYPFGLLRSSPDFYAMMLMNSWLGEHRNSSSHLYQVIRDTRGMNYGNYTYIEAYPMGHTRTMPPANVSRRHQIFQIWIRPIAMHQPGDMHDRALFATRAALREHKKLIDNGMTQETFKTTQNFLKNYTVNYGATVGRRLAYRLDDVFYGIDKPGHLDLIRPELDKLTLEAVNHAVRKHLQAENMWIVFITEDAEGLKRRLVSGDPTPIQYPAEKPASVLEEDKLIQSFPIPVKPENVRIIGINEALEE
jgi:zinc protease